MLGGTRNLDHLLAGTALIAAMVLLGGCAGTGPAGTGAGELFIVGGGLKPDNEIVLGAFGKRASVAPEPGENADPESEAPVARLLVLPTASGVPAESGPGALGDLQPHLSQGAQSAVLDLRADMLESGDDPYFSDSVDSSTALWFTGGVQSRILAVFRPDGRDSEVYRSARSLLGRDGVIAGTSAGAAMMSDPMIAWGNSREALLVGNAYLVEDRALGLETGMGFFPYGIVDQHFLRRGRYGRLVAALEATDRRFGFGVADNRALRVDRNLHVGEALGDRAVCVIDSGEARREGLSRIGLRFSLLGGGDRVDLKSGLVTPAAGKREVGRRLRPTFDAGEELMPFGRESLARLADRAAQVPGKPQRAEGVHFVAVVSADESSRVLARSANLDDICAINLRLDLIARPSAEAAAKSLAAELTAELEASAEEESEAQRP